MHLCKCGGGMKFSGYFRAHVCSNCGDRVVKTNENYIDKRNDQWSAEVCRISELETKVDEIIKVLNKITNPGVKE